MRTMDLFMAITSFLLVNSLPFPNDDAVAVVWQFPNTTWIENLAVRQTGDILCTSLSRDAVFMVNPFKHTESTVVHFEPGKGALGIAEISDDVFVVVTCQVDLATSSGVPGSAAAWTLDMNAWTLGADDAVTLIANLTDVGLPDGVVALSEPGVVLIADAGKGLVWKLDANTDQYTIVIEDDIFISNNPHIPLGVDGVHIVNEYLYFTNLGDNILGRVSIDTAGNATDEIEIVAVIEGLTMHCRN